jgi:hypothetical protein
VNSTPLKFWSYSSGSTLDTCPKRFALDRYSSIVASLTRTSDPARYPTLATSFGSALGAGVQHILGGMPIDKAIFEALLEWEVDYTEGDKSRSVALVVDALQRFHLLSAPAILSEWEVFKLPSGIEGKELGISILLPNGTVFRGFIDLVMFSGATQQAALLELKSSARPKESYYRYSMQGLIYQLALQAICIKEGIPTVSAVTNYQVYDASQGDWISVPFVKTKNEFLGAIAYLESQDMRIAHYTASGVWPQTGGMSACESYGRLCPHYNSCQHPLDSLIPVGIIPDDYEYDSTKKAKNTITLSLQELKDAIL